MNKKVLFLTGASGFVGSAALTTVMANTNWNVIAPFTMTHGGRPQNITPLLEKYRDRIKMITLDLSRPFHLDPAEVGDRIDFIWNLAADTDAHRALDKPEVVVRNNTNVMLNVLRFASFVKPRVLLHLSPSKMLGLQTMSEPAFKGNEPHRPGDAYLSSKSTQETLAYSHWRTSNTPVVLTHAGTLFGPRQSEGLVPTVIKALMRQEPVFVPANMTNNGYGESAVFDWLSVEDLAASWLWLTQTYDTILQSPRYQGHLTYEPDLPLEPHRFMITGQSSSYLEIVDTICEIMGVEGDIRLMNLTPHRINQILDGSKLGEFGWAVSKPLVSRLIETVHWYQDNPWALEDKDAA